jgi:hypothetical protein
VAKRGIHVNVLWRVHDLDRHVTGLAEALASHRRKAATLRLLQCSRDSPIRQSFFSFYWPRLARGIARLVDEPFQQR